MFSIRRSVLTRQTGIVPQRQATLISMAGSKSRVASARQAGRLIPLRGRLSGPRRRPPLSRRIASGHRRPIDTRPVAGPRRVSRPQIADASGCFRSNAVPKFPHPYDPTKSKCRLVPSVTCGAEGSVNLPRASMSRRGDGLRPREGGPRQCPLQPSTCRCLFSSDPQVAPRTACACPACNRGSAIVQ
jgi:hypothetical protein